MIYILFLWKQPAKKPKSKGSADNSSDDDGDLGSESEGRAGEEDEEGKGDADNNVDEDDEDWLQMQNESKKEMLDAKSKETHEVHSPYYPAVRTCHSTINHFNWLFIKHVSCFARCSLNNIR